MPCDYKFTVEANSLYSKSHRMVRRENKENNVDWLWKLNSD